MSIEVSGLSKRINQRLILDQISFTWPTHRIIGLVGRNGAGKTTLFRTMADHYRADAGTMTIDGQAVNTVPTARQKLFYIDTQNNFFGNQTLNQIAAQYALGYASFDLSQFKQYLATEKLSLNSHYRQLSKGQRMLSQILLALASNTPYVILDEPFDGLDILVRERIVALIISAAAEHHVSFLISSHNLDELDGLCDQALFLKDQQLIANYDLEELRQRARKLQLVFKTKTVPPVIKEHGEIVNVYGRVLEVYFDNYTAAIEHELKAADPVMITPCSLTITDVFRVKLGGTHRFLGGE